MPLEGEPGPYYIISYYIMLYDMILYYIKFYYILVLLWIRVPSSRGVVFVDCLITKSIFWGCSKPQRLGKMAKTPRKDGAYRLDESRDGVVKAKEISN